MIAAFLSSGFKKNENNDVNLSIDERIEGKIYEFDVITYQEHQKNFLKIPFTGKTFAGFKQALAFKESQGKYRKVNSLGYMGKYQFGQSTLESVGVYDSLRFINSPKLQERAFRALLAKNKWELRHIIEQYNAEEIDGVLITESGILAAAHLGGVGSVKKYFKSGGARVKKDIYGTSVASYLKKFSGYDTSLIVAKAGAKVAVN
jgi:hypothetical protein